MSGRAYVTLLSGESYLSGVIVLHRSLKAADALYPLYCLLSSTVPEDIRMTLEHEGVRCIRLESSAVDKAVNDDSEAFSHWNNTFDKLFVWGLTQFEKIVFLDSDMLIVRNIDSLFDKPPFSAVSADSSYPGNEGWAGGLNSGLMVISPDETMREELFGPVLTVYVYEPDKMEETLDLVDTGSAYALTGAIFSNCRANIERLTERLTHTAGNFYINDKPTGAVVDQQPFGGGRASGTNDKAGSVFNLLRWVSPQCIKETFVPATDYMYPNFTEE